MTLEETLKQEWRETSDSGPIQFKSSEMMNACATAFPMAGKWEWIAPDIRQCIRLNPKFIQKL